MCWCTSLRYLSYIQVTVLSLSVRIVQCWLGVLLDIPGSFLSAANFRAAVWLGLHIVGVSHELLPWILHRGRLISTLILFAIMFTFAFTLFTITHTKILVSTSAEALTRSQRRWSMPCMKYIICNHDNPVFSAHRASDLNTLENISYIWSVASSWCRYFRSASERNVTTTAGTRKMLHHPLLTYWNTPSFKHELNVWSNARSSTRMWNRCSHPGRPQCQALIAWAYSSVFLCREQNHYSVAQSINCLSVTEVF